MSVIRPEQESIYHRQGRTLDRRDDFLQQMSPPITAFTSPNVIIHSVLLQAFHLLIIELVKQSRLTRIAAQVEMYVYKGILNYSVLVSDRYSHMCKKMLFSGNEPLKKKISKTVPLTAIMY